MGKWNSKSQLAALVTARKQKLSATQVNGAEKRGTATGTGNCPCGVGLLQGGAVRWGSGGSAAPSWSGCGADGAVEVSQWGPSPFPAVPSPGGGEPLRLPSVSAGGGQRLPKDTVVL